MKCDYESHVGFNTSDCRECADIEEGHYHHCQQCDARVGEECYCAKGDSYMTWCSSNCRAAYDL